MMSSCNAYRPAAVFAAVLPAADEGKRLCDEPCVTNLESKEMTTTASGLQYRDIVVGKGPQPITGYQVGCSRCSCGCLEMLSQ